MSSQMQEVPKTAIIEFDEFAGKLAEFKIRYDGVVYDLTIPEQEKKARSDRFAVGKIISALDAKHKELKEPLKRQTDLLDGERKRIKDDLLSVQDKIKSQIETHEAKIAAHEEALQLAVDTIRALGESIGPATAQDYRNALVHLNSIEIGDSFEHRKADAALAKMETTALLKAALLNAELHEAEQAELARLRKEKEDRDRAEREERIRQEATAKAEAKAKEQAEQAKNAQERAEERIKAAEAQSKATKETAERDAIAAQERAKKEQSEAIARAEQATRDKIAKEQAEKAAKDEAERKAEESRVAKKSHRAKVEKEAATSYASEVGVPFKDAVDVIDTIRDGKIAHVRLEY